MGGGRWNPKITTSGNIIPGLPIFSVMVSCPMNQCLDLFVGNLSVGAITPQESVMGNSQTFENVASEKGDRNLKNNIF